MTQLTDEEQEEIEQELDHLTVNTMQGMCQMVEGFVNNIEGINKTEKDKVEAYRITMEHVEDFKHFFKALVDMHNDIVNKYHYQNLREEEIN